MSNEQGDRGEEGRFRGERDAPGRSGTAGSSAAPTPGKRSLVQMMEAPVTGRAPVASDVHRAAERGTSSSGSTLPHLEAIQRSFGPAHDVSTIRAHVGGPATQAGADMGAAAFATGDQVAFTAAPDLHTAAHEAAHVVQQARGVSLEGGVGAAGDSYEQQADAVADRVVAGQSAADLLGAPAAAMPRGAAPPAIQRKDTDAAGAIDYEAEFNAFSQRGAVDDGLAGYKDIRDLLIQEFGTIAKANAYYSAMKHPTFLGQRVAVHEQLAAALDAAEIRLGRDSASATDPAEKTPERLQYEAIAAAVKEGYAGQASAGGFNIRRNRNAKNRLSDHSFGTAIDIRAKFNPNLAEDKKRQARQKKNPNQPERFDAPMIVAVTDKDIGGDLAHMRAGGKTDELVDTAADIHEASERFQAAFVDESSVEHTMHDYLTQRLGLDAELDFSIDQVKDAAGHGKSGLKELSRYLAGNLRSMPDAEEEQQREDHEAYLSNGGTEQRWKEIEKKRLDGKLKQADAARARRTAAYRKDAELAAKGVTPEEIQARVWAPYWAAEGKHLEAETAAITDRAAQMLLKIWAAYKQSLQTGKQDKDGDGRRDPQTEGEPGTIAAHGFMDLPAKLVAALTGSDGGNLKWLGAYNQDFMHFELKDEPSRK